jgi:DNA-binding NarL/FixJ family response regulator
MIRILIADDHAIVREGLKQIVQDTSDITVAGEAADGWEVLELVREQSWDLVLLDLAMPGRGGIETLKRLKREAPNLPVLILSIYPEDQYAVRALKDGASGYLTKESAPDELVMAIRKAARGGRYVSPTLGEKLAADLNSRGSTALPHQALSDRELEVMLMLASGKTVTQVAKELSLSVKTISTNRARLLQKMGMNTNTELTYYAVKQRLLD